MNSNKFKKLDKASICQNNDFPMLTEILKDFCKNIEFDLCGNITNHITITPHIIHKVSTLKLHDQISILCKITVWNKEMFILIDKKICYSMIEFLFGGQNKSDLIIVDREFTAIEINVINQIVKYLIDGFTKAFAKIEDIDIAIVDIAYKPRKGDFLVHDTFIELQSQLYINTIFKGLIIILLPYETLLPVKSKLLKTFSNYNLETNDIWYNHISNFIKSTPLNLTVEINNAFLKLKDLNDLKVGYTLTIPQKSSNEVDLRINNITIGTGRIGKSNENLAVEVIKIIQREE
jgi:flagellar motor switch protein FliM